jgi:DNA-directed RNA polymerase subunit H (RpoH/RPB5)
MTSILFGDKKTGVALMRSTLDRLVASRLSDTVTIEQTTPDKQTRLVSAPRPCEACIVHVGSEHGATSDALKYLADLKREHASHLTVTELTMSQHLRANLLDHPLVPRMVRMSAEESKKIKLKEPHVLNMLPSSDVPVVLLGGLAGDIIVKYDDLKTGVVAKTYFRVVDIDTKSSKTNM